LRKNVGSVASATASQCNLRSRKYILLTI